MAPQASCDVSVLFSGVDTMLPPLSGFRCEVGGPLTRLSLFMKGIGTQPPMRGQSLTEGAVWKGLAGTPGLGALQDVEQQLGRGGGGGGRPGGGGLWVAPWLAVVMEESRKMSAGRAQSGPYGQCPGRMYSLGCGYSGPRSQGESWSLGISLPTHLSFVFSASWKAGAKCTDWPFEELIFQITKPSPLLEIRRSSSHGQALCHLFKLVAPAEYSASGPS